MEKSNLIKNNRSGKGPLFRGLILILALISFFGLIWLVYQYQQSQGKTNAAKQAVEQQIVLSSQFYPDYLRAVYGDAQATKALTGNVKQFDRLLVAEKKGSNMQGLSSSQGSMFSDIENSWKKLKFALQHPEKRQGNVFGESAGDYLASMNKTADIEKDIVQLRKKLVDLKSEYVPLTPGVIDSFTSSYVSAMVSLLVLAASLFALWILLQLRSNHKFQQEADKLRLAAEDKNKKDQSAILRLMDEMGELSEGDLTIEAQVTEDFTGAIADSVNFAVENMREMVGTIIQTSDKITNATKDTQNVSRLLRESSGKQSQQVERANTTARHMSASLHEIAESTDASVEIARSSVEIAQEGRNRVFSTIKSMTDIRENIQDTSKRIKRLGESSQEIGDIVEIIKSIADQTNVLALNAAIQATSAGEAGRGFAVVADEVQQLAERSANATKRIEVLVKTIQADANEAIASMESSTTQVVSGAGIAEEAGQSLEKIENVSQNLANLIVNVSRATRNAAGMAGKVATSMDRLSEINQEADRDVGASIRSIDSLGELSTSLKDSVSGFKLPN